MDVGACKESEHPVLPILPAEVGEFLKVVEKQDIAMFIKYGMALAKESATRRDMALRPNCEGET